MNVYYIVQHHLIYKRICQDLITMIFSYIPCCNNLIQCLQKPGQHLDALDHYWKWYTAKVIDVKPGYVQVAFDGWETKWYEWIAIDAHGRSERLAPLYTYAYPARDWQMVSRWIPTPDSSTEFLQNANICIQRCTNICKHRIPLIRSLLETQCYCESADVNIVKEHLWSLGY